MIENLREASPTEIDTELARLDRAAAQVRSNIRGLEETFHGIVERRPSWRAPWTIELNAAIVRVYKYATKDQSHSAQRALADLARYTAETAQLAILDAATTPLDDEFTRRGGWERAFVVITSGKGHVHDTNGWNKARCSTCRPTTAYEWLPELSGLDRTAIIKAIGEDACTVCYPGAPVGPRTVFTAAEKAARAAKAAQSATKDEEAAAKAAKGITNPDGTPLMRRPNERFPDEITSERAAQSEYLSALESAHYAELQAGETDDPERKVRLGEIKAENADAAERFLTALAAKRHPGVELADAVEAERAELAKKAKPRLAKADREWAAAAEQREYQRSRFNS
jgi:hypothetical protein